MSVPNPPPLYRRPEELGRRLAGSVLELGIKAYGAAAAVSVAVSDAESVGGKARDAVHALPNLTERYQQAKYVVEHHDELRTTLDYVHRHAPDRVELETAVRESSATLQSITSTFDELGLAWESLTGIRPHNVLERLPRAKDHVDEAWAQKPDLGSIGQLAAEGEGVNRFLAELDGLDVAFSQGYAGLLSVMDNFASDEVAATLGVMGAAFALAYALGQLAGFWGRRGRPGLVAGTLQGWGARVYGDWYVRNLDQAMGRHLAAVARRRVQDDIVADPRAALDPEALEELERYFEGQLAQRSGVGRQAAAAVSAGPAAVARRGRR